MIFEEQVAQYLHRDNNSLFATVFQLREYSKSKQLPQPERVSWIPSSVSNPDNVIDYTQLKVDGHYISIEYISSLAHMLIGRVNHNIHVMLKGYDQVDNQQTLHDLQPCYLKDLVNNTANGFSFMSHASNTIIKRIRMTLFPYLIQYFADGIDSETRMVLWNRNKMQQFMDLASQTIADLMCLIQVSSGQPARAPELASIMITNGKMGQRNVFVSHNTLMTFVNYSKTRAVNGVDRAIPRFMPQVVSQLVLCCI